MIALTLLFGLCTAALWGASSWLMTRADKRASSFQINGVLHLFSTLLMLPGLFILDAQIPSMRILALIAAIGICTTAAFLLFGYALKFGPVGVVDPVANGYAVVTLGIAVLLLGESLTPLQFAAASLIIAAVIISSRHGRKHPKYENLPKSIYLSVLAALAWGLSFALIKPVTEELDWFWTLFYGKVAVSSLLLLAGVVMGRTGQLLSVKPKTIKAGILSGTSLLLGSILLYLGIDNGQSVAILVVLTAISPLISSGFGVIFNGDHLSLAQKAAAGMIVVGSILIGL